MNSLEGIIAANRAADRQFNDPKALAARKAAKAAEVARDNYRKVEARRDKSGRLAR